MKLVITYRDKLGCIQVEIDSEEILFLNGEIWFDYNGEEYRIKLEDVVSINRVFKEEMAYDRS